MIQLTSEIMELVNQLSSEPMSSFVLCVSDVMSLRQCQLPEN